LMFAAALAFLWGSAALADDAAAFDAACRSVGGEAALCACKAEAAVKLLDDRMLGLVIVSMTDPAGFTALSKSGVVTDADNVRWMTYLQESSRACNPSD
jgi:hypothetical protein